MFRVGIYHDCNGLTATAHKLGLTFGKKQYTWEKFKFFFGSKPHFLPFKNLRAWFFDDFKEKFHQLIWVNSKLLFSSSPIDFIFKKILNCWFPNWNFGFSPINYKICFLWFQVRFQLIFCWIFRFRNCLVWGTWFLNKILVLPFLIPSQFSNCFYT